ncbi:6-phosphogluconolactonase [Kallotenue papyrolyticum]|uniref:6-phosphogluconolactonase n=1 Tax=Kallotenue papyrolyticum TaxID=1325125 RepID=UPI00047862A1|nr:6-phosphogluconolactonase [Kallotenue papyrolyticum]
MTHRHILVVDDPEALAEAATRYIVARARQAVAARGSFALALAGGSTPRGVYRRLAHAPWRDAMPWAQTLIFWSDERALPLDSTDSNYRMAREALLDHVPLPPEQIHPLAAQGDDLDQAAARYEAVLRRLVPGEPPRFDLILLGMGPDGHTASLFPHSPALDATTRLVVATPEAPLPPQVRRLTFTSRLINAAVEVLVLVAGADKAAPVREVLQGPRRPHELPAQLIDPQAGDLWWMLDRAAASQLSTLHE